MFPLIADRIILVSTRRGSPTPFDPDDIFVEAGDEFGRQHAAAYADVGTAQISFGCAQMGLGHFERHGGSAYLPERLETPFLAHGRLYRPDAAEFRRRAVIIGNIDAPAAWPWLNDCRMELALLDGNE